MAELGVCDVHRLVDKDTKPRKVTWCNVCKSWICEQCKSNVAKRAKAMLLKKTKK